MAHKKPLNRVNPTILFMVLTASSAALGGAEDRSPKDDSERANGPIPIASSEALDKAFASDRTLVLEAKDYHFKSGLVLSEVKNLTLRGQTKNGHRTRILVQNTYSDVLVLKKVENIRLENLTLGHAPEAGECTGGVLKISDSSHIHVENVHLFGSGIEGLAAQNAKDVILSDSIISECTQAILTAIGGSDIEIRKSTIKDNHGAIRAWNATVTITESQIHTETDPRALFEFKKVPEFLNLRRFTADKTQKPGRIRLEDTKLTLRKSTPPLPEGLSTENLRLDVASKTDRKYKALPTGFLYGSESVAGQYKKKILAELKKMPNGMGVVVVAEGTFVHASPDSKPIGTARLVYDAGVGGRFRLEILRIREKKPEIGQHELHCYGYKNGICNYKTYKQQNGWVKVLAQTIESGVWVDLSPYKNLIAPQSFIEELSQAATWQIYGYDKFKLYEKPTTSAKILTTLSENKHAIKRFTGRQKKRWAEAEVYETEDGSQGGCMDPEPKKNGKSWTGWIRILNKNGEMDAIGFYSSC